MRRTRTQPSAALPSGPAASAAVPVAEGVAGPLWPMGLDRRAVRLTALALGCALIGLLESSQVYLGGALRGQPLPWSRALTAVLPSWFVLGLLIPAVVWVAHRFPLSDGAWRRNLFVHAPASTVFAAVHIALGGWLSNYVLYRGFPLPFTTTLWNLLSLYFVTELLFYWGIVGAYYALDYYRRYRERERQTARLALEASRLEADLAHANLQALRMQLHPHFLFNTLNAVGTLALKGERERVVRTLTRLSEMLRLTLESSAQLVTVRDEMEILERYLDVEQVRFGDRLTVRMSVPADALEAEVPTLLLQPVVENALRHGVGARSRAVRVDVRVRREGERLHLEVVDDGPGFPPALLEPGALRPRDDGLPEARPAGAQRRGIGLANVAARLARLYPGDAVLELDRAPSGGARVRIEIPFRYLQAPGAARPEPVRMGA